MHVPWSLGQTGDNDNDELKMLLTHWSKDLKLKRFELNHGWGFDGILPCRIQQTKLSDPYIAIQILDHLLTNSSYTST